MFWSGQLVSLIGTWMQNAALSWLVYLVTHDRLKVGIMSVYSLVFGGLAPIGSMYSGTVAKYFGPQITFIVSGFIGLIAFLLLLGKRKELT